MAVNQLPIDFDEDDYRRAGQQYATGLQAGDPGVSRRVFIVHGDPDAQIALEPKIQALGLPTLAPHWHQHVTLD